MNIRLPEQFIYTYRGPNNCAYVEDGILYIEGTIHYEDLMYNLAYKLHGYNTCYYCGESLFQNNRTLDHIYPRSWGGISLPDNLYPACKNCNNKKTDMTLYQFKRYLDFHSAEEKLQFYLDCVKENKKIIEKQNFILPSDWVTLYDASVLINLIPFKYLDPTKMQKLENYYNYYHHYPHPIVVSSNGWLFKGKHILYHARKINNSIIPAIVLENVIVIKNTS